MAILTTTMLKALVEAKADWSARPLIVDGLSAIEEAYPINEVEIPAAYTLDDVVDALVALGLVTVSSSS
jgi:hypothetical protein